MKNLMQLLAFFVFASGSIAEAKSQIHFYKTRQHINSTAKTFPLSISPTGQAIFAHTSTSSRPGANVVRIHSKTATGFQLSLENEDSAGLGASTLNDAVDLIVANNGAIHNMNGSQIGEVRTLTAPGAFAAGQWRTLLFNRSGGYVDPVVTFQLQTKNEGSAAHIRVRNLTANSVEYRIEEWDYLDDAHVNETVAVMVVEIGTHLLQSGKRMVAGVFEGTNTTWQRLDFGSEAAFDTVPAVISQVVGQSSPSRLVSAHRNVSLTGMDLSLRKESTDTSLPVEDVHVIAVGGASYLMKLNFKKSLVTTLTDPSAIMADFVADASPAKVTVGRYGDFATDTSTRRITVNGGTGNSLRFDNVIPTTPDGKVHRNALYIPSAQMNILGLEQMTIGVNIYSTRFSPGQVILSQLQDPVTGANRGSLLIDTVQKRDANGVLIANQQVVRFSLNVNSSNSITTGIGAWRSVLSTTALPLNSWSYYQFVFDGRCIYIRINGAINGTKNCFIADTAPTGRVAGIAGINYLVGAKFTESTSKPGTYNRSQYFVGELDEISIYDSLISLPPNNTSVPGDICMSVGPLPTLISATKGFGTVNYSWAQYMPEKNLPLNYNLTVTAVTPTTSFVTTGTNFTLTSCPLNANGVRVCSRQLSAPYQTGVTYRWTIRFIGEALDACPNRNPSTGFSFIY